LGNDNIFADKHMCIGLFTEAIIAFNPKTQKIIKLFEIQDSITNRYRAPIEVYSNNKILEIYLKRIGEIYSHYM